MSILRVPTMQEINTHWRGRRYTKHIKQDGVSMEFEAEFKRAPSISINTMSKWIIKDDGSLRNYGLEFVSPGPRTLTTALAELDGLMDECKTHKNLIADLEADRTGYHVHTNIQNMTPTQIITSILCYWLIESSVSFVTGRLREGNLFCLRLIDAPNQAEILYQAMSQDNRRGFFETFDQDRLKYSGLNLYTIVKFGTLEFRMMRGVFDRVLLKAWTKFCHDITYNHGFSNPTEVLNFAWVHRDDPMKIIERLCTDDHMLSLIKAEYDGKIDTLRKKITASAQYLMYLGYMFDTTEDWISWEKSLLAFYKGQGTKNHERTSLFI